jgi:hypothetical protein
MTKKALCAVAILAAMIGLGADTPKGKAVILVQDISGSIVPYFPMIQKVFSRVLIDKRLEVGDYFTLIAFSGKPSIEDGAQIQYPRDIDARKAIWSKVRPEGDGTDIGLALQAALKTTVELRNQGYANFDPLVIFVTDGEHEPLKGSPFEGKNADQIFADPFIGDKTLYQGWYFVGIGKDLKDIKRIAELAGRSDSFLSIDDLTKLEEALDSWLSKIPPSSARENAEVKPLRFSLGGRELDQKRRNYVAVGSTLPLSFSLVSGYLQTDSIVRLESMAATFQSSDKTAVVDLAPAFEQGRIDVPRKGAVVSTASLHPSDASKLVGPGTLKLEMAMSDNYIERSSAAQYDVVFLSPGAIFWKDWAVPIAALAVLLAGLVAYLILKAYLPASITMEVLGSTTKYRLVKLGVGDKAEVGTKPSSRFLLEGNFDPVVLAIRRSGKSSWEVLPRSTAQVKTADGLKPYKLGSLIKLEDGDGNDRSLRFIARSGR